MVLIFEMTLIILEMLILKNKLKGLEINLYKAYCINEFRRLYKYCSLSAHFDKLNVKIRRSLKY